MMRKKHVVISTMFEEDLESVEEKLDEMGVSIIEMRYDLLWHRYEIYVRVGLKQVYELMRFKKHHAVNLVIGG